MEQQNWISSDVDVAKSILAEVMNYRRTYKSKHVCSESGCPSCSSIHLPKILMAIEKHEPVPFVLPAFPGKSPNPEKVLGHLPDQAEVLSIKFLGLLNQKIKRLYPPGIQILLCSDGRVFSDVVGMEEDHVTAYQSELRNIIFSLRMDSISTFDLDDVFGEASFSMMREKLLHRFGISTAELQEKIRSDENGEASLMYRGITRFLFEDSLHAQQTQTKSALQREARVKAYEVIRRSNAWSELIEDRFPDAIRLSIHPQVCGSKKLGIRLMGHESWMTPWHGAAVETENGFILLTRKEAEALGARLVCSPDGRPSHYKLESPSNLLIAEA
jgi:pyoverdine/dityrosine biosynthesis protein Dit1